MKKVYNKDLLHERDEKIKIIIRNIVLKPLIFNVSDIRFSNFKLKMTSIVWTASISIVKKSEVKMKRISGII
jgi:hypothetical protein